MITVYLQRSQLRTMVYCATPLAELLSGGYDGHSTVAAHGTFVLSPVDGAEVGERLSSIFTSNCLVGQCASRAVSIRMVSPLYSHGCCAIMLAQDMFLKKEQLCLNFTK